MTSVTSSPSRMTRPRRAGKLPSWYETERATSNRTRLQLAGKDILGEEFGGELEA